MSETLHLTAIEKPFTLEPVPYTLDKMTAEQSGEFFGLSERIANHLDTELNYSHHLVIDRPRAQIYAAKKGFQREAAPVLEAAINAYWRDHQLAQHYHQSYLRVLLQNTNVILRKLPKTVEETFKPMSGVFTSKNYRRVRPLTGEMDGCFSVNTWKPFVCVERHLISPEEHAEASGKLIELFTRLLPDDEQFKVCLDWFAHLIQKPWERPTWHLMWPANTGLGKGFLFTQVMYPLLEGQAWQVNKFSQITGKHSTANRGNLFVMIDDAQASDSQELQMKSLLTEKRVLCEPKFQEEQYVEVYSRYLLASNEKVPMDLAENDRRWYVVDYIDHRVSPTETDSYFADLNKWLSVDTHKKHSAMWHFLNEWPISTDLSGRPPVTKAKEQVIEQSEPDLVQELIAYFGKEGTETRVLYKELFAESYRWKLSDKTFSEAMAHLGFEKKKMSRAIAGVGKKTYYRRVGEFKTQAESDALIAEIISNADTSGRPF